jgi:hypothetical protein
MCIINSLKDIIRSFKSSIVEIGYCILLATGACLFAADSAVSMTFFIITITVLGINMLARSADGFLSKSYAASPNGFKKRALIFCSQICRTVSSFNLALLFGVTGAVLVHEGGHLAVLSLIFEQAHPHVTMYGLLEASTDWTINQYTAFGAWLGPLKAGVLVAGAGALTIAFFATMGMLLSFKFAKNYPKLSNCIFFSAVFSILTQVNYAFSAFFSVWGDLGHDFMHLWQGGGIHPLISIACLIAIPIIVYFFYRGDSSKSSLR